MAKKTKTVEVDSTEILENGIVKITMTDETVLYAIVVTQEAIETLAEEAVGEVDTDDEEEKDEGEDDSDLTAEDLKEMDEDELREVIEDKGLKIKGAAKMDEDELLEAVAKALDIDLEDDDESDDTGDDGDELTGESLAEMDFEELEDLCEDKDLDVDPDDYDEDDIEKLRKEIAKELDITLPKKGKK